MRFRMCFGRALILSGLLAAQAQVRATSSCYPTFQAKTTYKAGTTVSASIVEHTTEPCAPDLTYQADKKTSLCNADGTRPVAIMRTYNYRCVDGSMSLYCQQGWAFDPASLYGHLAWEKLDECHVSISSSFPPSAGKRWSKTHSNLFARFHICWTHGCLDNRARPPCFPIHGAKVTAVQRNTIATTTVSAPIRRTTILAIWSAYPCQLPNDRTERARSINVKIRGSTS